MTQEPCPAEDSAPAPVPGGPLRVALLRGALLAVFTAAAVTAFGLPEGLIWSLALGFAGGLTLVPVALAEERLGRNASTRRRVLAVCVCGFLATAGLFLAWVQAEYARAVLNQGGPSEGYRAVIRLLSFMSDNPLAVGAILVSAASAFAFTVAVRLERFSLVAQATVAPGLTGLFAGVLLFEFELASGFKIDFVLGIAVITAVALPFVGWAGDRLATLLWGSREPARGPD